MTGDGIQKAVVGAVIVKEGKALLIQRTADDFMGGLVELPSGTVDLGEDLMDALIREITEETGLTVSLIQIYLDDLFEELHISDKTRAVVRQAFDH
ncbi:MAG: NUDIX domain-containing protein [Myxococcota bacterium]|nr:NUDIX domain-containing protein [Myxococcota bacterium]